MHMSFRSTRCRSIRSIAIGFVLFAAAFIAVSGCGGPKSVEVSGNVTFDGKPLPSGRIYFNPDYTKGPDGPQGYAEIKDGKFDTRNGGKGAFGGPTIVVIKALPHFKEYQEAIDLPNEPTKRNFDVPASAGASNPLKPPDNMLKP